MVEEKSILKTVLFHNFSKWNVNLYLNKFDIKYKWKPVSLEKIMKPRKERIKNKDYKGQFPIVEKIRFSDGKVFFREEKNPKTDLNVSCVNDLLVSNINFEKGAFAINTFETIVTSTDYQSYELLVPIDFDYFNQILRTEKFLLQVKSLKSGGMKTRARYDFLKQFEIPIPPISEQKAIVQKYQDTINEAEKLEKEANFLLNDSHLYFDNLLQIEDIQPSFVSGLNFIHYKNIDLWGIDKNLCRKTIRNKKYKTVSLENLCSVGSGGTPSRNHSEYYRDGNIPWIKTTEVIDEIISDTEEKITQKGLENSSAKLYEANSLIIAMYGQGKTRGRTAKLNVRATTNQACAVLYDINESLVNIDYLWFYFQNEYERIRELASGNNQPNLNAGMIKTYPIVLPPLPVQNDIVEHINHIKAQVKDLRQQAKELREKAKLEFERSVFE